MQRGLTETEKIVPFLKWAGGKRWLTWQTNALAPADGARYFEPFMGSAAMFFHSSPAKAVLSDSNAALVEAYAAIKSDFSKVESHLRVHAQRHSKEYYYEVRAKRCLNEFTRAAKFIYLNRTCWNGLYRVNRDGVFNVPKGSKATVLLDTDDFEAIALRLSNAELLCSDFEKQIDRAGPGDVIFADPPYTVRHNNNGFVKYNEVLFEWEDQIRLRDSVLRAKLRGAKVLLTNADHSSIRALYGEGFEIQEASRYSAISGLAQNRGKFSELLIS